MDSFFYANKKIKYAWSCLSSDNFTVCRDGDVKLENNIPSIFRYGDWHLLCAECFNETQVGAEKFCNELGYESGVILTEDENDSDLSGLVNNATNGNETFVPITYDSNPIVFGRCLRNDIWPLCTGPCIPQEVNGTSQNCAKGLAALRIECSNPSIFFKNRTSSC